MTDKQQRTLNRIVLNNGCGIKLVLTEICRLCDTECPTTLCGFCKETFCDDCVSEHKCEDYDNDN